MKIYVACSSNWNFEEEFYNPIKNSSLNEENELFYPLDEENKEIKSKDIIRESDLVIVEASITATGVGIELGWADCYNVPILVLYKKGKKHSASLKFITNNFIEYEDEADMVNKIKKFIIEESK